MTITRLTLTDFRCYRDLDLAPGAGLIVLTGDNGAGKTNVLEAVSLLAPGRGLRGAGAADLACSTGRGGYSVAARIGEAASIGTGTTAESPERRIARINGVTRPVTALGEWLSIAWLTPAMDRLFSDSAGDRRRFVDRLVLAIDPHHAHHSTRYEAAMRQRNRLLSDERPDEAWLDALEHAMAVHGAAIGAARASLIERLDTMLADQAPGPFARAALSLAGWDGPPLDQALRMGRARDAAAGRTLIGPHRQDLIVSHRDKDQPAARCSTGEQKALLIGIVLAHAALVAGTRGAPPILLLDEVAAHLDPARRAALFERIVVLGGQAWLTGTEAALFDAIGEGATRYHVHKGVVEADISGG